MTCRWALLLTAALILAPLTIPFPVGGSPATGALAQSQGGAGMSCATTAQIAAAWPPSGEVSLLLKGGLNRLETGGWRLDDVEIVALDCGNTRGLGGVDTFLVYRVPWRLIPASGSLLGDGSPPFAVPSPFVLAVLPQGTSQMINLHVVQPLDEFGGPSLGFQDVTGDGVPEVIFEGPRFRSTGELRIWRWQDGAYASVFDGSGYVGGLRMVDLDGDGRPEMVLAGRVEAPNTASGFAWPLTYRWNGQRFVLSLVSAAHTEIIRDLEERLRNPQFALEPATVGIYATFLGHAYTIQGRTGEAREAYSRAWVAYPRALEPYRCDEPTQAVLDFYVYLPGQLPRAYGMAEAALGGSFPEFAAGFARTRRVSTSERQLLARDGDRYLVGVRVQAVDLTEDGETETLFSGVWRIRRDSATRVCTLEEATLTVGAPAWSVPAAPVPVPPALGGWAEVVGAEQCVPVRVSPGLDRTMTRCLPDGFATLVAAGPELHDNAIWWGLAGQGWTTDDALRRRQGAAPSATSRPGLREAGQVAYLGPDSNFWLVNADGTERQRLTNDEPPYSLSDLVWSPRGDAIAFTRRDLTPAAQSSSVRIMSLDGRVQRDIPDASTPAWSPDGRKLAYLDIQRTRPAEARTPDLLRPAIMNLETDQVLVIDSPVQAASFVFGEGPRWSPDSASLVYVAGRRDIHLVSADGRPIRTMNACARLECSQAARPTLSPSGDALAWLVSQPGGLSPTSPPGGPPAIGPPGAPPPFGPSGEPPPIGPPGAPRPFGSAAEPPPLGPPGVPPPVGPPGGPTDRLGRLWLVAEDVATGQGYIQIDLGRLGGETMCPPGALSWSAGGRAIVVNARCLSPGQNGVVQVDVATGALQITPAWDVTAVSLSSDERYMAFSTVLPLPTDVARGLQGGFRELRHLWVSSIDGGDPVLLGEGRNPVWRPMTP